LEEAVSYKHVYRESSNLQWITDTTGGLAIWQQAAVTTSDNTSQGAVLDNNPLILGITGLLLARLALKLQIRLSVF
jgi:hypothetical protein